MRRRLSIPENNMTVNTKDESIREGVALNLGEVRDAIYEIESAVYRIDSLLLMLVSLWAGLSDEGKLLSEDLRRETKLLVDTLNNYFDRLRGEIASTVAITITDD
jgi:hypothetical protein